MTLFIAIRFTWSKPQDKTESKGFDNGRSSRFFLSATKLQSATSPFKRVKIPLIETCLKVSPTTTQVVSVSSWSQGTRSLRTSRPPALKIEGVSQKYPFNWPVANIRNYKLNATSTRLTRQLQVTRPHKQLAHILWSSKLIIDHIIAVALMRDHTFSSSLGLSKWWIHIKKKLFASFCLCRETHLAMRGWEEISWDAKKGVRHERAPGKRLRCTKRHGEYGIKWHQKLKDFAFWFSNTTSGLVGQHVHDAKQGPLVLMHSARCRNKLTWMNRWTKSVGFARIEDSKSKNETLEKKEKEVLFGNTWKWTLWRSISKFKGETWSCNAVFKFCIHLLSLLDDTQPLHAEQVQSLGTSRKCRK